MLKRVGEGAQVKVWDGVDLGSPTGMEKCAR